LITLPLLFIWVIYLVSSVIKIVFRVEM
jgi:hypothetical protein